MPLAPNSSRRAALLAVAATTLIAALLRFSSLHDVPLDPFYDAAVRSMSQSLHNFFFGAFEPGGSVSIDKPPIDLWLQVISVKLFGFGSTQLKLPQALAGTLAVPLLYDALRRPFGELAAVLSALVLALLPIAVLTSRSDTMDSVMMALSVAALWTLVRFAGGGGRRWLFAAAALIGLAFNVKLFQALVPVPALALLAALALRGNWFRPALLTAGVFTIVALSWLVAASAVGGAPYAIGSSNGSAWNAAFVFNGYDRIAKPAGAADLNGQADGPRRRPANDSELARAQVAIGKPGPLRLFDHDGPLSGLRLGYVLIASLLLGVPALLSCSRCPLCASERPAAAALLLWLATGLVLFSVMARLHPRYTEAFTPAVAAAAGVGLAWVGRSRGRTPWAAACAAALAAYGLNLLGGTVVLATVAVCVLSLFALTRRGPWLTGALAAALLILPSQVAVGLVRHRESDAGRVGFMRPSQVTALSAYLRAHQQGARYEVAAGAATQAGALIVRDGRPVLVLTTFEGRPLVGVGTLMRLARAGEVRYALLGAGCGPHGSPRLAACSAAAVWVRAHGHDVSRQAGLLRAKILWQLP
ncbi:MAG: hypothetical protein NVSMB51_22070 [Solirubrobacteraceae bacterium]